MIELKYRNALNFSEGFAAVSTGNSIDGFKYGFINKDDKVVIPFLYKDANSFKMEGSNYLYHKPNLY